ncbi:MAG: hydroxymethylbilane synthase [Terriglobales bacterium]
MSIPPLHLGTRGSALARWQATHVQSLLAACGRACSIQVLTTSGDQRSDVPLAAIGGKGLFTLELESALLAGRLDLAVHSLKDVPSSLPEGLILGAVLERADARDALVAAPGMRLQSLRAGARLGTGSLRRQAQARALCPALQIVPVRGNVDTRLRRWRAGDFDALLLAAAGLDRLGLAGTIAERLDPRLFLPAAGQGVLVLECRAGDSAVLEAVGCLHHGPTAAAVAAERALLRRLECGCQAPVAALAQLRDGQLHLDAMVASSDGVRRLRRSAAGAAGAAETLGLQLAESLLRDGAAAILAQASPAPVE